MIGLPMDFGAEIRGNAKYYQTCLAQVLREINSVTDLDDEILASFNGTKGNTTSDQWKTSHITASSCVWDNHKEMLRRIGYDTLIDAEFMKQVNSSMEFGHFQGFWDEGTFSFFAFLNLNLQIASNSSGRMSTTFSHERRRIGCISHGCPK